LALQGTLDTFSLPDVLRLLATTSKSGRLRLDGDRGHGSVWLNDGRVVDALADRAVDGTPADEVVFELLRFSSGSFAFDADDHATDTGNPEDVDTVLRRATSLLSEWTELEAVVPSLGHHVSLAGDLSVDEVTIDADRWRSLVAVASGATVGELATTLGLTELGVSRAVRDLVDLGVAEIEPPGTVPDPPRRPASTRRDMPPRRSPARPETESVGARMGPSPLTGETPRAGWLTGDVPAVPPPPDHRTSASGNGSVRASSLDDTVASPAAMPTPPPEPPSKGGLTARRGRNRGAIASSRSPGRTTGSTPPVTNGTPRPVGRTPVTPSPRTPTNDTGQQPRVGGADTSPSSRRDTGTSRLSSPGSTSRSSSPGGSSRSPAPGSTSRSSSPGGSSRSSSPGSTSRSSSPGGSSRSSSPGGASRPGSPSLGSSGPTRGGSSPRPPASGPSRSSSHSGPAVPGPGAGTPGTGPSPFDGGRLGPPPSARDTGQIRPIMPSALPPDLHWAADDTSAGSISGGPNTSPFSGLSNLGPSRPAPMDGEIAPHVAAMSPEARSAVQSTVGNAGGSAGGRGPSQGEDIAQRGRLISFLSTVR
jgi:hypothetical protein